jgi:hypothetical protein
MTHTELTAAFAARRCVCGAAACCVVVLTDHNYCLACIGLVAADDDQVLRSEMRAGARHAGSRGLARGGSVTGPPLAYQETP